MMNQNTVVTEALSLWLQNARAQHLPQFGAKSAAQYAEAVERSHSMAHHPCISTIHGHLQNAVQALKSKEKNDTQSQMRDIDVILAKCAVQEIELKQLINLTETLRAILRTIETDLHDHQSALSSQIPIWQAEVKGNNPLDDQVVRNDTAARRLQSITALVQSCQSSAMQLSLMYNQLSRLYENLTTLRQVTYPIWQQKAIHRTMLDDQAFLNAIHQTLTHTGEMKS